MHNWHCQQSCHSYNITGRDRPATMPSQSKSRLSCMWYVYQNSWFFLVLFFLVFFGIPCLFFLAFFGVPCLVLWAKKQGFLAVFAGFPCFLGYNVLKTHTIWEKFLVFLHTKNKENEKKQGTEGQGAESRRRHTFAQTLCCRCPPRRPRKLGVRRRGGFRKALKTVTSLNREAGLLKFHFP